VGPLDLDRQRLPPAGHDPRHQPAADHLRRAVDLHSGQFLYQVCRKAVSASFTGFCEQLLAAYPTAPVVAVVCDNVIIHHSKIVQAWLASHPRVRGAARGPLQPVGCANSDRTCELAVRIRRGAVVWRALLR
jgi:hypothetical protein